MWPPYTIKYTTEKSKLKINLLPLNFVRIDFIFLRSCLLGVIRSGKGTIFFRNVCTMYASATNSKFSWVFVVYFFTSLYKKFIMSPCVSICYICSSTATFLLFARGVYGHLLHMYTKNVKGSWTDLFVPKTELNENVPKR